MATNLSAQTTIADLLKNWPSVMPFFIQNRLPCIGCEMARFETLEDLAKIYHLDLEIFLHEIISAVDSQVSI